MTSPNLFNHAQREVHQDALVAYLFDWLRPDSPETLRAAAKDIISCLLGTEVERTEQVATQWRKLDVLALVKATDG